MVYISSEVTRLIWVFVSLVIAGTVIATALSLSMITAEMSRAEQRELHSINILREFREFNIYNNSGGKNDSIQFTTADILAAIMRYKGEPEIEIVRRNSSGNRVNFPHRSNIVWANKLRTEWNPSLNSYVNVPGTEFPHVPLRNPQGLINDSANWVQYDIQDISNLFTSLGLNAYFFSSHIDKNDSGDFVRIVFTYWEG